MITRKSNLPHQINRKYFEVVAVLDFKETLGEKSGWKLHTNAACCFEQIVEVSPDKTPVV